MPGSVGSSTGTTGSMVSSTGTTGLMPGSVDSSSGTTGLITASAVSNSGKTGFFAANHTGILMANCVVGVSECCNVSFLSSPCSTLRESSLLAVYSVYSLSIHFWTLDDWFSWALYA